MNSEVTFISPEGENEKRKQLIESVDNYADARLTKGQKEVLKRAIESLPNLTDAQQLFDWLTISRANHFNFDYTPVYSNSKIATLKPSTLFNGCINPKINPNTNTRDYLNENKLIIGDNFDALNNLLLTHKNKIDVIYIDPPYNTDSMKDDGNHADQRVIEIKNEKTENGESKFAYNDSFYRDDWLSRMKLLLEKAKKLMNDDAIIFVSIDDSEQAYLKVLMDEIFGEENFISCLHWLRNPGGESDNKYIAKTYDFILFYAKNKTFFEINDLIEEQNVLNYKYDVNKNIYWKKGSMLEKSGENDKLINRPNLGYVIYYNEKNKKCVMKHDYSKEFDNTLKINDQIYKFDEKLINDNYIPIIPRTIKGTYGRWRMGLEKAKQLFLNDKLIFEKNKNGNISVYEKIVFDFDNPYKKIKPKDWIDFTTNSNGTKMLNSILINSIFSKPKPYELIKYLVNFNKRNDGIILDFFAGSGTTGHAIMELNKEDGGKRKFILCTNNQNNIAKDVCGERLYRIINGVGSNGENNFDWLKNNEPYKNESVGIYETNIIDLSFDSNKRNVLSIQDLGNETLSIYSQFSNEIINENVFSALTTLPIIEEWIIDKKENE